jgi:hypothetical protein
MALGKHSKNSSGKIRKERSDSLARNLAKDYAEFKHVPGNTKLGTLEKRFGVNDLSEVRKKLMGNQK